MADDARQKVLLMGKSGSGKTSMRSVIFANYLARDTNRLNPTLEVQHSNVRFLGSLVLSLWDCGGQDAFFDEYFSSKRDHVFAHVRVLIYVFDVSAPDEDAEKDLKYYETTLEALASYSPGAKVFVLVHKMDTVPEERRDAVFEDKCAQISARSGALSLECFKTSIWDETLYKAWSNIVYSLIPNVRLLEERLRAFADACDADEAVLFESATFLVISHATRKPHGDVHRFEKISNIVKQFKLSCMKASSGQLLGLRAGNSCFTVHIQAFTSNTHLLCVTSDPEIPDEATLLNVAMAKPHFERLIAEI